MSDGELSRDLPRFAAAADAGTVSDTAYDAGYQDGVNDCRDRAEAAEKALDWAATQVAGVRVVAEAAVKMGGQIDPTVLLRMLDEEVS